MNVLVAYASKRGATAEIAETVAHTVRDAGLGVDCLKVGDVDSVDAYDAIVLGSAVYIKRWRGDAKHFLRKHGDELTQRPLWVFSSGPVGEPGNNDTPPEWTEPPSIVEKVERLGAREHVVFGGRLPVDSRLPGHRTMVEGTPPEYRDMRGWDQIRAWRPASRRSCAPPRRSPARTDRRAEATRSKQRQHPERADGDHHDRQRRRSAVGHRGPGRGRP